ncbi:MAG TPA: hypothetical protein VK186_15090 [Candidatus Deferrimicrobium sp.]|nr:hypothetical protein [Candidatus Deferrimicrobium sp.]
MNNIDNTFNLHGLKQHSPGQPGQSLGVDFETRVFAKIKKKKTQRKVVASAALSMAVFAFIYIGQAVLFHRDPGEKIIFGLNGRNAQTEKMLNEKEEVPVMEDVVFASYDQQNDYAVEKVAYNEHENTI